MFTGVFIQSKNIFFAGFCLKYCSPFVHWSQVASMCASHEGCPRWNKIYSSVSVRYSGEEHTNGGKTIHWYDADLLASAPDC